MPPINPALFFEAVQEHPVLRHTGRRSRVCRLLAPTWTAAVRWRCGSRGSSVDGTNKRPASSPGRRHRAKAAPRCRWRSEVRAVPRTRATQGHRRANSHTKQVHAALDSASQSASARTGQMRSSAASRSRTCRLLQAARGSSLTPFPLTPFPPPSPLPSFPPSFLPSFLPNAGRVDVMYKRSASLVLSTSGSIALQQELPPPYSNRLSSVHPLRASTLCICFSGRSPSNTAVFTSTRLVLS